MLVSLDSILFTGIVSANQKAQNHFTLCLVAPTFVEKIKIGQIQVEGLKNLSEKGDWNNGCLHYSQSHGTYKMSLTSLFRWARDCSISNTCSKVLTGCHAALQAS